MNNAGQDEENLSQKAGRSGAFMVLRKTWGGILNLAVMAYLARTLDMHDFGLAAISTMIVGFAHTVTSSGIGDFIVYYPKEDQKNIQNAAFWLNVVFVFSVFILLLAVSPFFVRFYEDDRISTIIGLLSIGFLSSILSIVPQAVLQKNLDFQKIVPIQIVIGTLSQSSSVFFAWFGFGVYSLILPTAIFTPILGVALFWRSGFRPDFKNWGTNRWKEIFRYSKQVISTNFFNKAANDGDTLLVGKLLGAHALGLYDVAFRLANMLNQNLLPIISSISMPIFARNQHDKAIVRRHYLKMLAFICFVSFPMAGAMGFFARDIILTLYGSKWEAAIIPFQLFCVFSAFRSIGSPTSGLYNAMGLPQIGLRFMVIFTPILLFSIYVSSFWGLISVCLVVTILRTIGTTLHFYIANWVLNFGWSAFWQAVAGPLCSCLLTIIILVFLPWNLHYWRVVLFGLLFFGIMMMFFSDAFRQNLVQIGKLSPFLRSHPRRRRNARVEKV